MASTSTTASIGVGGIVQGSLEVARRPRLVSHQPDRGAADHDLAVSDRARARSRTPYLNLRDASGKPLAHERRQRQRLNSKIVFTATTSGTYFIDAGAWDTTSLEDGSNHANGAAVEHITGSYALSVQPYTPPPVWNYDQIADQLVNGYWNAQGGQPGASFQRDARAASSPSIIRR